MHSMLNFNVLGILGSFQHPWFSVRAIVLFSESTISTRFIIVEVFSLNLIFTDINFDTRIWFFFFLFYIILFYLFIYLFCGQTIISSLLEADYDSFFFKKIVISLMILFLKSISIAKIRNFFNVKSAMNSKFKIREHLQ